MRKTVYIIFLLIVAFKAESQVSTISSQYLQNPLIINPSFAGNRQALCVAAYYRAQWVGIEGAPESMRIEADAPLFGDKVGLGIALDNEEYGISRESKLITNYAFRINFKESLLALGLGAGLSVKTTHSEKLYVLDRFDDLYQIADDAIVIPDFSLGIHYFHKDYFAGFSLPGFIRYKYNYQQDKNILYKSFSPHSYLFQAGARFRINEFIRIDPSALIILSQDTPMSFNLSSLFSFYNRLGVGASYQHNRSLVGFVETKLTPQIRMAYSYEFDLGKINQFSKGSHGIMLKYEFRYQVEAPNPLFL